MSTPGWISRLHAFLPGQLILSSFLEMTSIHHFVDCYKKVEDMFGKVSFVGNVAGVIMEENWKRTIDVNLVRSAQKILSRSQDYSISIRHIGRFLLN